ncbi:MAG: hypothetical protein EU535_00440 [Promethearchaeota archaeon]|nr:MAG: hypothetical protein EU535_00440 [Candidatus Lokiarchaeota archaeon]
MKVLALGGSGDMGRMTVAILLESPIVSSITVADKNYERANHFIDMVGSDKLTTAEIDVTEHETLVELISEHDLVINTVGPYYKFNKPILKATIEAKTNYIDINDDAHPTLESLNMDQNAKDAGITAVIGFGASPGLTNLMAVLACSELDVIDDLITAWGWGFVKEGKKPKYYILPKKYYAKYKDAPMIANAATMHLFYETLEKIPTFKGGKIIEIEPLTEAESLKFPGFKDTYVCHIGHPEPVTLPRVIQTNSVSNLMYMGKIATDMVREYSQKIANKKLTIKEASVEFSKELRKRARSDPEVMKEYADLPPGLCVIATGSKNGKRKKVAIAGQRAPFGGMAGVTGVPLAIGAMLILEEKIKEKGVFTPEEIFNKKEGLISFFDRFAQYCGKNLTAKDILLRRVVEL